MNLFTWSLTALAILRKSFFKTDLWSRAAGLFCFLVLVVASNTDWSFPAWIVTVFLFANPNWNKRAIRNQIFKANEQKMKWELGFTTQKYQIACRSGGSRGCLAPCWTSHRRGFSRTPSPEKSCSSSQSPISVALELSPYLTLYPNTPDRRSKSMIKTVAQKEP